MTTEEKVKQIIAESLAVDTSEVVDGATLREDLEADSMDMANLALDLEEGFNVEFEDQDGDSMKTVADVVRIVTEKTTTTH